MMDPAGRELIVRLQLGAAILLTLIVWASFVWFK
jgi:succinate dehydrogenase / fumarate reductase, cytochrome b subunit